MSMLPLQLHLTLPPWVHDLDISTRSFAGDEAKVALKLPQDGRRKLQGRILRAEGDNVVLLVDGAEIAVPLENIEKARLVPDWAAMGLAPAKKPGRKQ